MDELLDRDPEPCDTCKTGLMKFVCFDGLRRCQKCITKLIITGDAAVVVAPVVVPKKKRWKKGTVNDDQQNLF